VFHSAIIYLLTILHSYAIVHAAQCFTLVICLLFMEKVRDISKYIKSQGINNYIDAKYIHYFQLVDFFY